MTKQWKWTVIVLLLITNGFSWFSGSIWNTRKYETFFRAMNDTLWNREFELREVDRMATDSIHALIRYYEGGKKEIAPGVTWETSPLEVTGMEFKTHRDTVKK